MLEVDHVVDETIVFAVAAIFAVLPEHTAKSGPAFTTGVGNKLIVN